MSGSYRNGPDFLLIITLLVAAFGIAMTIAATLHYYPVFAENERLATEGRRPASEEQVAAWLSQTLHSECVKATLLTQLETRQIPFLNEIYFRKAQVQCQSEHISKEQMHLLK